MDGAIGKTPLVRLCHIEEEYALGARLLAKVELFNPTGSVKDRAALYMLEDAERRGLIRAGATIIEPTSGNTGIGLCALCAMRSYRAIIVMPENMSRERQLLMRAYGAELVLTDASLGMAGAIERAKELHALTPNSFIPSQFDNEANARAHYETTGPEIFEDTDGEVDIFVAGVGTGGTLTGTGEYLKDKLPNIKIVAVEPASSAVLSGKPAGAHGLQGIGAGFIPKTLNTKIYDEVIPVTEQQAYEAARTLGKCEGVLVGISSGAALFAAAELARREENKGKRIVVLLPDGGDHYLSTELFEDQND